MRTRREKRARQRDDASELVERERERKREREREREREKEIERYNRMTYAFFRQSRRSPYPV